MASHSCKNKIPQVNKMATRTSNAQANWCTNLHKVDFTKNSTEEKMTKISYLYMPIFLVTRSHY